MKIDPTLHIRRQKRPDDSADVIVVCASCSDEVCAELRNAGLEITNLSLAEGGMVCGRIRLGDLEKLERLAEVESVSPDSEQSIQSG